MAFLLLKEDEMHNFTELAQRLQDEYRHQPGLTSILSEGEPAIGLRYKFTDDSAANRFMKLRELQFSYEPVNANELVMDGSDVIEIWRF